MNASIRQLLVHVDYSPRSAARLQLARRLAHAHGASLTALYAVTPAYVELPYTPEIGQDLAASLLALDDERRAGARAMFEQGSGDAGVRPLWSESTEPPVIGAFAQQALHCDLMVLGQHDSADRQGTGVPADFAESVIAQSGKAALVVPYAALPETVGDTVVIAWKETREAARAVAAAIPLLQRAAHVHVLTWDEEESRISGARLDLQGYLRLHQVEAVLHHGGPAPEQLGEQLLSRAFDLGADLLVMGCYGHGRAREWVLGGTSRTVLRSMTLPVLMSH